MDPRSWLRTLAVGLALLLAGGCVPATPDDQGWRTSARRTVAEVASEAATVELVLRRLGASGVFAPYATVQAVASEEAAGAAAEQLAIQQPPAGEVRRYSRVTHTLDTVTSLLADVRIAVADRDEGEYPALIARLHREHRRLDRLAEELQASPSGTTRP
jgi:hypothetical protein